MVDLDQFVESLLGVFRSFLLVEDLVRRWDGIRRRGFRPRKLPIMIVSAMAVTDHSIRPALLISGGVSGRVRWW